MAQELMVDVHGPEISVCGSEKSCILAGLHGIAS
jgi:hypothetical protein